MNTSPSYQRVFGAAAVSALAITLVACSTPSSEENGDPTDGGAGELDQVSLVLDWTPNTNHTGLHVAQELGYYEEEGVELELLGFSTSGVESVLDAGGADFGISGAASISFANAAGSEITSVFNVQQVASSQLAVRADRDDLQRPSDLDGTVYAGFGLPFATAVVTATIQGDGGTGEFDEVSLSTAAYDALYSGTADFAVPLVTWEGVEAELNGTPLRYFDPQDYGVAPTPSEIGISARAEWIEENRDLVERFVRATQRGYQYAVDNPEEAGEILIEANPEANLDPELVRRSQELLSTEHWPDADGSVGTHDPERWQEFVDFLTDQGLITDADGQPLESPLDIDRLFTNDFVSS